MIYCFDIDNTICETDGMDYANAKPIPWMVEAIQKLHAAGHEIRYYTARGFGTDGWGKWKGLTRRQLAKWDLPFGPIFLKPYADVYVDDRMKSPDEFRMEVYVRNRTPRSIGG